MTQVFTMKREAIKVFDMGGTTYSSWRLLGASKARAGTGHILHNASEQSSVPEPDRETQTGGEERTSQCLVTKGENRG